MMDAVEEASKLAELVGARRLPHELKGDAAEPRKGSANEEGLSTRPEPDPDDPPPLTCRVSWKDIFRL